jgi:prophage tail gpP-like protein
MDNARVEIRFDGVRYGGWTRAEVRASVDDLCASLRLDVTLPGTGKNLGITPNTVIDVLIAGQSVYTMRLDSHRRSVGKDSHDISLEGRTLARELIDSQYSKTLSGLTLGEIAKRLCDDFKVPLTLAAQTKEVPEFSMQCESPANALINTARTANLLLYPMADGGLILAEPSNAEPVTKLVYGTHLLDYEIVDEYSLRFSEYCVKDYDSEENEDLNGKVTDSGIEFYRPMHLVADKHGRGLGGCERRAELERNRRLARAHRIDLNVQGWRYQAGNDWRLWDINTQVRVVIPPEGIDDVFLIGDRSFRLDDRGGTTTHLTIMQRDAFMQEGKGKKGKEEWVEDMSYYKVPGRDS